MTSHSSVSIPQPKNWQDFERNSRVLFECVLNDINVQNNGRSGQRQHGVDIFGQKDGQGSWYGIQCKGKDANYGEQVTEEELRSEVNKTRKFEPAILYFILITTAPVDAAIQAVARTISEERTREGCPLNVAVWGWGELEARIAEHPRAMQTFHPDMTPFSTQLLRNDAEHSDKLDHLIQLMQQQNRPIPAGDGTSATFEVFDKSLHAEIDDYRDLFKDGKPVTALRLLEGLKGRIWDAASSRIKFRLLTNIASCKLKLGNEEEAIDGFLAAIEYQPEDKIGLANVALAYLLKGEIANAVASANAALKQDKTNADAASYLVQACVNDAAVIDPLALVPDEVKESESVDIARLHFSRTRNDSQWIDDARGAFERHPNSEHIKRYFAEADLVRAFSTQGWRLGQKSLEPIDLEALAHSAVILQELWNKQYENESSNHDPSLAVNLIQAYKALEKDDLARSVAVQGIEKMPNDPNLIKFRAAFYMDEDRMQEALELLQSHDDPECLLAVAEILAGNSPAGVLEKLKDFEQSETTAPFYKITAICLRVDAWLVHPKLSLEDKINAVEKEYLLLQKLFPESLLTRIVRSQILQASEEDPIVVKQVLTDAKAVLKEETAFYERFLLAKKLESIESYVDVAELLDGRVDVSHDSPALRTLLIALLNSDQRMKAYKLLSEIPAKIAEQPLYLRVAISLHLRRGDYRAAEEAVARLLDLMPTDLQTHLTRVDIWQRRRDDTALRDFLMTDVEELEGTPEQMMRMAQLLARFGFEDRAYRLGYATHLQNPKIPEVQLAYMGLLLEPLLPRTTDLDKEIVESDAAFSVKNALGETITFVIENDNSLNLTEETVPPNHMFAVAANGLSVGEAFTVKGVKWEIISIKHKYLHLLHRRLEQFERHFPENGAIQVFNVKQGDGSTNFEPFFRKLREQHEHTELALDTYQNSHIPLEFFSDYLGRDVIDAWYSLAQSGRKFKVCHGNLPERESAMKDIDANSKAGCVVDTLTLHIIRALGIEKAVVNICGPIAATQSTIDTFRLRLEQWQLRGEKPYMTLFWRNGQVYRNEITTEQLAAERARMAADLDWIERDIEVLPAETEQPIPEEAARIRDALSYSFLDSILAAQGYSRLLLCEDQTYRQFGVKEFGVRASWLQPVLMQARDRREITSREYCEAVYNLIIMGHNFTAIDASLLQCAVTNETLQLGTIVGQLFGVDAELASNMQVMAFFLDAAWDKGRPSRREQTATGLLLQRFCFGEWTSRVPDANPHQLLDSLANAYNIPGFIRYLRNWRIGHVTTRVGYELPSYVAKT